MKLRLQLAGPLPATAKLGPTDLLGKGAFGTTMQEMMAMLSSGKAALVGNSLASPGTQPQAAMSPGTRELGKASEGAGAEAFAAPHEAQAGTPLSFVPHDELKRVSDTLEGQSAQPPEAPPLSGETSAEPALLGSTLEKPPVAGLIVREQQHVNPGQDKQQPRQPVGGATPPISASSKDASSRTRDKAEPTEGGGSHAAANGQSSDVPLVSQAVPVVVPMPIPQLGESKPASSKSISEPEDGRARVQDASGRTPVPTTLASTSGGDPQDGPHSISASPRMLQPRMRVETRTDKVPESVPSNSTTEHSQNNNLDPRMTGKTDASTIALPQQGHHPQASPSAELVTNAKQEDTRDQKEPERKIGLELGSEVTGNLPHHAPPIPLATQHEAVTNALPAVSHATQNPIDAHRPPTTAAQLLQRMDMAAASGTVQLRADARRLDVGVSSDALGWVEVRATTTASGRVDATLQVQNDSSAHVLANQSREISDYAREHSVPLGELSVGVGTGDATGGESRSAQSDGRNGSGTQAREAMRTPANDEHSYGPADSVSFISVRA